MTPNAEIDGTMGREERGLDSNEVRRVGELTVRIDRSLCVGFADCITTAPEAFELDDEGVAIFKRPDDVPRWRLLEACAACPVDALTVLDEDDHAIIP